MKDKNEEIRSHFLNPFFHSIIPKAMSTQPALRRMVHANSFVYQHTDVYVCLGEGELVTLLELNALKVVALHGIRLTMIRLLLRSLAPS